MERNMCAEVRMEEGYMRTIIEYNNPESKLKIQKAIAVIENNLKIFPIVIRKAISENAGNISVEFEIIGCVRDAGSFSEALLQELDIKTCEV